MGLFQSKKVIGLDIGTTYIKMAELNVGKTGSKLVGFGYTPTPENAIDRGEIKNIQALSESISKLHSTMGSKRNFVCTSVWGSTVIVKKITLPRVDENIIGDLIRDEAEQYIPFDLNEVNLEYHLLNNGNRGSEQMDILLLAAQKEFVMKHAEVVELAGLSCSILDVSGFAVANIFEANYGIARGEAIGLLNIGAGVTNFVVVDNGGVVFSRDIPVGGLNYTNDLHKQMDMSLDEAEGMKLAASRGQEVPEDVLKVLQSSNESVVDEIQRSLDFYMATASEANISKFYITGGSSLVLNLRETLSATMSLPFQYMDPFMNLSYDTRTFSPDYISQIAPFASVSMGLGMRKVGDR